MYTHNTMGESQRSYSEWQKSYTKEYALWDSKYMKSKKRQNQLVVDNN